MKKFLIVITGILLTQVAFSQIILLDPVHPGADLSGSVVNSDGLPTDTDLGAVFYVYNAGPTAVSMKVRRTEVDVVAGTRNVTCWKVCPAAVDAGVEVVQLSALSETVNPSDTNKTFFAHCYPEGIDGCSYFKYEWVDAANPSTVYATVDVRYAHTTTTCAASVEDLSKIDLSIYPNPATNNVTLKLEDVNSSDITYEISNLLGQKKLSGIVMNDLTRINTSILSEGVYFVSIKSNGKLARTEKLVVKH